MSARRGLLLAAGAAALASTAIAAALWPSSGSHPAPVARADERTVVVAEGARPLPAGRFYARRDCLGRPTTCVNGTDGIELAYRVLGDAPQRTVTGIVETDENCQPDSYGVSHCLNRISLAGGRSLTVRHDHDMGNDPCLSPGERVRVVALSGFRQGA